MINMFEKHETRVIAVNAFKVNQYIKAMESSDKHDG
jgi:hypothetical protein